MGMVKILAAGLLALVLVAGCAKPAPTPTPPAPTPGPVTAPTPTPRAATPAPTPVAALKPTGELRLANGYLGVEVGDPSLGPSSGVKMYLPIFDYLVGATPQGQLSPDWGLAERWEVSHSATSSAYTFYLRKGIRFHNGEEFTAEDVKFSIEYFMRPASISSASSVLRANLDRVEVADRYKVVIHTKKPYGFLLVDLSPIGYQEGMVLPKKYIQEKGEANFNLNPIGTGAYRFLERSVGSYARFEALENHWLLGVPKYKSLIFFLVPEETTRIAMLKVGQADIIDVSRERMKDLAGFSSFLKPGSEVVTVLMDSQWQTDTYLHDKRVREALMLAINREEILKFLFEGQGEVVGNGSYGSWALNYKPFPLYPYDPERAKKLLSEAFPKGVELTINSFNRPGVPELQRMNEAVAGMWSKVGVKAKIVPLDYGAYRAKQQKGELPNGAAGFPSSNRPFWTGYYRIRHHSQGMLTITKVPELDALIEAAEGEVNLEKAVPREWEMARYVRENHLIGSVLETGALYAGNPKKVAKWDLGKLIFDFNIWDLVRRPKAG